MMSIAAAVTDFASAHPHLAYATVFLLALSEAIPIVGAFIPGSAVIIGISALVPSGVLTIWPLLVAALAGAIISDGFAYWIGHHYHREILLRRPLNRYPEIIARSEGFLQRHGGKSVFLARFTPGVRAFVPLMAGILQMPMLRFYVANILSALAWAPSHILSGVLVGASLSLAGAAAGRLAVLLVAMIITLWLATMVVRKLLNRGIPLLLGGQERLREWANTRDNWLSGHLSSLLDPARKETKVLAILAIVLVGATWMFFGVLEDVVSGDPLVRADISTYRMLQDLRTPWGDTIMVAITELGDTAVVVPVTLAVLAWLAWRRAWKTAAYWLAAVSLASVITTGIKATIHYPRPGADLYSGWNRFSFPSGHISVNAVMYGFLAFLIAHRLRAGWRLPVALFAAMFIILIAFSRLYLGAHWFSDVVGGLAFGTAWVALLSIAYRNHQTHRDQSRGLLIVALSALVVAGSFNIYREHARDVERYATAYLTPMMVATDWWAQDWRQLPEQRIDLEGDVEEPLTVQWAGSLPILRQTLLQKGWRLPEPWTFASAVTWLIPHPDPLKLPALPYVERGLMPSLTLVHPTASSDQTGARIVLRLWATDIKLNDGERVPLWIGSVVEEQLSRPLSLLTVTMANADANAPRDMLAAALDTRRLAARRPPQLARRWDGQVLLARDPSIRVARVD